MASAAPVASVPTTHSAIAGDQPCQHGPRREQRDPPGEDRKDQPDRHPVQRVHIRRHPVQHRRAAQAGQRLGRLRSQPVQHLDAQPRQCPQRRVMGQDALAITRGGAAEGQHPDACRGAEDVEGDADPRHPCGPRGGHEPAREAKQGGTGQQDDDRQEQTAGQGRAFLAPDQDRDAPQAGSCRTLQRLWCKGDPTVHRSRKGRVMGRHDHGHAAGLERHEGRDDLGGGCGVEVGCRLVGQQHGPPRERRAGEHQPPRLTPRDAAAGFAQFGVEPPGRRATISVAEARASADVDLGLARRSGQPSVSVRRKGPASICAACGTQAMRARQPSALAAESGFAVERDLARVRLLESADQ
jgi:hypothetical protein